MTKTNRQPREYLYLPVAEMVRDKALRHTVIEYYHNWDIYNELGLDNGKEVEVTIILDYPLTRAWTHKVKITKYGELYVHAADLYRKIYRLDTKSGGDMAIINTARCKCGHALVKINSSWYHFDGQNSRNVSHDCKPFVNDCKCELPKVKEIGTLLNKITGKYVWGHCIGDLIFEGVSIKKFNQGRKKGQIYVYFLVGS